VAQVVEHLPSNCEALNSNLSSAKKRREKILFLGNLSKQSDRATLGSAKHRACQEPSPVSCSTSVVTVMSSMYVVGVV
jgi:hypothetical protein